MHPIWQEINARWLFCHSWRDHDRSMITAMTFLMILLVVAAADGRRDRPPRHPRRPGPAAAPVVPLRGPPLPLPRRRLTRPPLAACGHLGWPPCSAPLSGPWPPWRSSLVGTARGRRCPPRSAAAAAPIRDVTVTRRRGRHLPGVRRRDRPVRGPHQRRHRRHPRRSPPRRPTRAAPSAIDGRPGRQRRRHRGRRASRPATRSTSRSPTPPAPPTSRSSTCPPASPDRVRARRAPARTTASSSSAWPATCRRRRTRPPSTPTACRSTSPARPRRTTSSRPASGTATTRWRDCSRPARPRTRATGSTSSARASASWTATRSTASRRSACAGRHRLPRRPAPAGRPGHPGRLPALPARQRQDLARRRHPGRRPARQAAVHLDQPGPGRSRTEAYVLGSRGQDYAHINSVADAAQRRHRRLVPQHRAGAADRHQRHDGHRPGDVVWRLGGERNEFTFVGDPLGGFCAQHDAPDPRPTAHLLLFDNGARGRRRSRSTRRPPTCAPTRPTPTVTRIARPQSRVVEYDLDVARAAPPRCVWSHQVPGRYAAVRRQRAAARQRSHAGRLVELRRT